MSEATTIRSGNVTKGYADTSLTLKTDKIDGKSLSTNTIMTTQQERRLTV